jgi:hypothetical protein
VKSLTILGIAIWIRFPNEEVLLQQKIFQKGKIKIIYFEPLKGWVGTNEFTEEALKRLIKENVGFYGKMKLSFRQIKREFFGIPGKGTAVRYHFLVDFPYEVDLKENVQLIGREDLKKIKRMSEKGKNFQRDIILFDNDYKVLFKIFGVEAREISLFF